MLLRMFEKRLRGYRAIGYACGEAPLAYGDSTDDATVEHDTGVLLMQGRWLRPCWVAPTAHLRRVRALSDEVRDPFVDTWPVVEGGLVAESAVSAKAPMNRLAPIRRRRAGLPSRGG